MPQAIPPPGSFITDGLDPNSAHGLPLIPITVGKSSPFLLAQKPVFTFN
jgi:hypothetical protein